MCTPAPWLRRALLGAALVVLAGTPAAAQTFNSGSTGADGPFNPTSNTTPSLPPTGVFNFTTINIPAGVTVTFTKNTANTPVVLLATGNVTISGTLDLSGSGGGNFGRAGVGGPGGFDGGVGGDGVTAALASAGVGLGGGAPGNGSTAGGGGGGYGTGGSGGSVCGGCSGAAGAVAGGGGPTYGSSALRPILGGSGGGGGGAFLNTVAGGGGGGGGGAIVIASSTSIALNTAGVVIRANGGTGSSGSGGGGGGSGGAIRVIAPTISGSAQLQATGGSPGSFGGGPGGAGRIRLEATTLSLTGSTNPLTVTSLPQPVFPGTGQPSLTIASVGGIPAPATPSGNILAAPDILLPTGTINPVNVGLAASNIPLGTTILVTATPQSGAKSTVTSTGLTGTTASSTATASLTLSLTQTSVLTATATFPLVASAGSGPLYAESEEVTHIRVAAVFGGSSTLTYLTRSGREIVVR